MGRRYVFENTNPALKMIERRMILDCHHLQYRLGNRAEVELLWRESERLGVEIRKRLQRDFGYDHGLLPFGADPLVATAVEHIEPVAAFVADNSPRMAQLLVKVKEWNDERRLARLSPS